MVPETQLRHCLILRGKRARTPRLQFIVDRDIGCLSFKPLNSTSFTEQLLVGGNTGRIYLYKITWEPLDCTESALVDVNNTAHSEQITGLTWSTDGTYFATGGTSLPVLSQHRLTLR